MAEYLMSEIQTAPKSKYSQCPKTERSVFRQRRNPNKGLFEQAVFGFRSFGPGLYRSVPNYFEHDKSVWNTNRLFGFQTQIYKFTYTYVSEIQTFFRRLVYKFLIQC